MRTRFKLILWISVSLILYILFLGSRTEELTSADELVNLLFSIGDADAVIDESVVKNRYGLQKNYDKIESSILYIKQSLPELRSQMESSRLMDENSLLLLKVMEGEFTDKYENLLFFREKNSLYTNSLTVLPKIIKWGIGEFPEKKDLLEDHMSHVLFFSLEGGTQSFELARGSLIKISKTLPQENSLRKAIVLHTETILQSKKEIDSSVNNILDNNFGTSLEKIGEIVFQKYNSILYKANIFNTLLYSISLGILIYAAFLLIRVFVSSYSLRKMNDHLVNLNHSFSKFVPTESLQILSIDSISTIELGKSVKKEMTVLFSDIRSFTTLSERMSPEENFDFINSYLREMGPIVRQHNGFIDKFIGDAIMALFKEDPEDAIKAGIQMIQDLKEYNKIHRNTPKRPPIEIGIGVHSGEMMFGTVGENNRMETTVISDTVNLASRIESITKFYGVHFLISEHIFESLDNPDKFKIRFVDKVRVKGKSRPIKIYEVYDADTPEFQSLKSSTKQDLELAIKKFYERDPKYALEILKKCKAQFPDDPVVRYHHDRSKKMIPKLLEPEEEWDDATEPKF